MSMYCFPVDLSILRDTCNLCGVGLIFLGSSSLGAWVVFFGSCSWGWSGIIGVILSWGWGGLLEVVFLGSSPLEAGGGLVLLGSSSLGAGVVFLGSSSLEVGGGLVFLE